MVSEQDRLYDLALAVRLAFGAGLASSLWLASNSTEASPQALGFAGDTAGAVGSGTCAGMTHSNKAEGIAHSLVVLPGQCVGRTFCTGCWEDADLIRGDCAAPSNPLLAGLLPPLADSGLTAAVTAAAGACFEGEVARLAGAECCTVCCLG